MAAGSQKPTFKDYQVERRCYGCGRKIVAAHEPMLLFTGYPRRGVYASCCHLKGLAR